MGEFMKKQIMEQKVYFSQGATVGSMVDLHNTQKENMPCPLWTQNSFSGLFISW